MPLQTSVSRRLAGDKAGINSVEVAADILLQLANFRQPITLKILSQHCNLSPSKVHRYLSSLTKLGFTSHGEKSGKYSLGKNAILLGLAAMHQIDQIDDVMEEVQTLVAEINCHVGLSVWSKAGPTIVRWERSDDSLVVPFMLGQVLPILHSASGRVFAAFLDPALTRELIAKERASYNDSIYASDDELKTALREINRNRFAISKGEVESETTAISTPIVDWQDNPIVVITALISKNSSDDKILSILTALRIFSENKSVQRPSFPFAMAN